MPTWLASIVLVGHFGLLLVLCIYGMHRLYLTWQVLRWPSRQRRPGAQRVPQHQPLWPLPVVTVQLPIYNEKFVVERLIDAVAALRYPPDRLQIQVLDDSTDDTVALAQARVAWHRARGVWIEHLHRTDRTGYKAGALAAALPRAAGELIAIFDADFVPGPELLHNALAPFADPRVGMVQTRWEHLNRGYNALTQVQAIMLDAHFAIDQPARHRAGVFFNFNGTAGIWRAQAIRDAGGWHWDTITEDLDLSYRAQLHGWRFAYLQQVGCPSELPVEMNAFKSQQHRWAKGAIQVMRKTLPQVWRAPLPLHHKLEATLHLSSNLAYLLMLLHSAVFLLPSILVREQLGWGLSLWWLDLPLLVLATGSHLLFFLVGQRQLFGRIGARWVYVPALLATSVGLGLNNGRAVLEALLGRQSAFVRTPKLGAHALQNHGIAARPRSYAPRLGGYELLEIALAALYAAYTAWAVWQGFWTLVPFLLLFVWGLLFSGVQSLRERNARSLLAPAA